MARCVENSNSVTPMSTVSLPVNMTDPATKNFPCSFILFVYIITFLIGVPANILAFCTFCRKVRRKPAPIDILLLNLTISDLIFLAFLPFKMKEAIDHMAWNLPYFLCPVTGFLFYSTIYTSTLFLTGVSVERYLSVAHPIRYMDPGRTAYAMLASVVFWVVSLAHCSIVFVMQYLNLAGAATEVTTCYEDFNDAQLRILLPVRFEMFMVLFCVPFLICSFCYFSLIRILSRKLTIARPRRLRAIRLALGTLVVFILCFGPYNMSHIYGVIWWGSPHWRVKAILLSIFNACLDPIIFYFSSSDFRSTFGNCLKSFKARRHRQYVSTITPAVRPS